MLPEDREVPRNLDDEIRASTSRPPRSQGSRAARSELRCLRHRSCWWRHKV